MIFYIDTADKRNQVVKNLLKEGDCTVYNLDKTNISAVQEKDALIFAPNKKFEDSELEKLPNNILLFCGNLPKSQMLIAENKNIKVFNLLTDELFAIKNAKLTAEGILCLILQNTENSIFESKILIMGSGRVGKATAILFEKMGVKFSLFSSTEDSFNSNHLFSGKHILGSSLKNELSKFDIIINTIPAKILDENDLKNIKSNCLFLEIASIQSIAPTPENAFTYLLCPALPQRFSSQTAGKYMFECIINFLKN